MKIDKAPAPKHPSMETAIGGDTTIEGKLHSTGVIRIDGKIKGEVQADDTIIVGPSGVVQATLTARKVIVSGKVHDNIYAEERLELQPTCEIKGDIHVVKGDLIIEGGARLDGACTMGADAKPTAQPQAARPAAAPQPPQQPPKAPAAPVAPDPSRQQR